MDIMELGYCADGSPVLFVRSGRNEVYFRQKQERALDYFSELSRSQGYITREDAEYGAKVNVKPMPFKHKKSILEKVIGFFVEVEE